MRIFFVITGIGLGHTMREAAIIKEIRDQTNAKIKIAGFENSYNYFKDKYETIKIHGSKFPQSSFNVSFLKVALANLPYPFYFFSDSKKLKKEIKDFDPDLLIVDTQPVGAYIGKKLNLKTVSIYNLDLETWNDFEKSTKLPISCKLQSRFHYKSIKDCYKDSDLVIIPSIKNKKSSKKIKFVDPVIRTYPNEMPPENILMKKLNLTKKPILVMLGGSTFGFSIAKSIVKLSKKFNEHFIIFGYKSIETDKVSSFRFKENFLEYLKVSKAVILLSGHTALSETLVYKKPSLVFPFKNYVEHYINVSEMKDVSLIKYVDSKLSEETLESYIKELIKSIPELKRKLNKLNISYEGTKQAVDLILKEVIAKSKLPR